MSISYKLFSGFYGLLDVINFRKNQNNPRYILSSKIQNNSLKVLEIAIGTAKDCILLAKEKQNLEIIGIDFSKEILEIAKKNITKAGIQNIELVEMNIYYMGFEKETFDIIIISFLLHESIEVISNIILMGCERVLKKNGKLYVIEWDRPKKTIGKIIFGILKVMESKEFKEFMKKDMNEYFKRNGFKVKSIEYGEYSKVIELVKSANVI